MHRKFLAFVATICLAISVVVHGATYFGKNLSADLPIMWPLHVGAIGFVLVTVNDGINWDFRGRTARETWANFLGALPRWLRWGINLWAIYAVVNFMVFVVAAYGEPFPARLDGRYTVYDVRHGQRVYVSRNDAEERGFTGEKLRLDDAPVMRTVEDGLTIYTRITEQQYRKQTAPILRGFSGYWMFFYLIPFGYFGFHK